MAADSVAAVANVHCHESLSNATRSYLAVLRLQLLLSSCCSVAAVLLACRVSCVSGPVRVHEQAPVQTEVVCHGAVCLCKTLATELRAMWTRHLHDFNQKAATSRATWHSLTS